MQRTVPPQIPNRAQLALQRTAQARAALGRCLFCAHECGVNRSAGETGPCQAGMVTNYFSAQTEVSDESELSPTFAIALGGCDIRCRFCITRTESWSVTGGRPLVAEAMGLSIRNALENGARAVMILGGEPTIHLHSVLDLVSQIPDQAILAWKTNGRGSEQSRALLDGIFDYWVVDYKFGNDACALRLSGYDACLRQVHENLRWAAVHSKLIIRHLLMPGHIECCWRSIAGWIAENLPQARVNLRAGFWPRLDQRTPELNRTVSHSEAVLALSVAHQLRLALVV